MTNARTETGAGDAGKILVAAAALVIVVTGVRFARPVLVPLLLAGLIATVTAPLVVFLKQKRVPTGIAVAAAMLVDLAGLGVFGLVVVRSFAGIEARLPVYAAQFEVAFTDLTGRLTRYGVSQQEITEVLSPGTLPGALRDFAQGLAGALSNLTVVLLIVVFMLLEVSGLREKLASVMSRPAELERVGHVAREVNKYLAMKLATSAATGLLCGIWAAIVGLDFPVLWGLLAFILNFIPTLGSVVAAVPPIALAIVQLGIAPAVLVLIGYAAINLVIGNIIEPRVMGRALGLSPLVVFFSVVFWGWLLGPAGAILSVPLTMIAKITFESSDALRWLATLMGPAPGLPEVPPRAGSSAPPGDSPAQAGG